MGTNPNFFRDGGHLNDEGIALYVDGLKLRKTDRLPQAIPRHVEECEDCRGEITALFRAIVAEEYDAKQRHPFLDRSETIKARHWRLLSRAAAVIALLAGAGLVMYFATRTSPDHDVHSSAREFRQLRPSDTGASATQRAPEARGEESGRDESAASFAEAADLEDLVGQPYRSGSVLVLEPEVGKVASGDLVFRWESDMKEPLRIRILDNRENAVHTASSASSPCTLAIPTKPGLYYWKLETDDELLYVGKFFVKSRKR